MVVSAHTCVKQSTRRISRFERRPRLPQAYSGRNRPYLECTAEGERSFYADPKTQDAVIRNLEVIGEAVKNLSEEVEAAHADVPWR